MKPIPAIWTGGTQFPPHGATGVAWPAFGIDDPESAEFRAWCFEPDIPCAGEEGVAYYCDPETDLVFRARA